MNVFIIVSTTLDGFISKQINQNSFAWTSKADKKFFRDRSKQAGVVVMGKISFDTIDPKYRPLVDRLNVIYTRQNEAEFLSERQIAVDRSKIRITQQSPTELIEGLAAEGYKEVAICGGSSIYTHFLKSALVDKIYVTVEPVIFGDGVKLFNEELDIRLKLVKTEDIGEGTVLLEYDVLK
jgi:dihydrofolate reductase